jgi:hypothetical protein
VDWGVIKKGCELIMDMFKLQNDVWKIAEEKGWHEGEELSFGEFIALCHSELSEALEIYRNKGASAIPVVKPFEWMEHASWGAVTMKVVTSAPVGIPIELADVIMRILDYCETHGIPMYQAIEMKMNYNKTREHRHGGKVI